MGRKTRRKVPTRPKPSIPDIFECPNCNENAIHIDINRKTKTATATCGNCHVSQENIPVRSIEEKVDVYGNFVDTWYKKYEPETIETTKSDEELPNSSPDPETSEEKVSGEKIPPNSETSEEKS